MNWRSLLFATPFVVVILVLAFAAGTTKLAIGGMSFTCPVWILLVTTLLCVVIPLGFVTDAYDNPLVSWIFGSPDFRLGARRLIVGLAILSLIILVSIAIQAGKLPWDVLLSALLLIFAAAASAHALDAIERGSSLGFESHWGGLGGGSGGWRLSPATGAALLALSFTGAAIAVGFGSINKTSADAPPTGRMNDKGANNGAAAPGAASNAADASNATDLTNTATPKVDKGAPPTDRPKLAPPPAASSQAPAARPAA
ncbi:hypothetical protein [Novosphingobium resinovorum]|uniref:hypothetical protein n=1 Tax=Novosphingobium resinovorum TaxID=158500 RepID=UPI002ED4C68E|nr:hypothetical protein [Novosphingobium resinovorum]